MKVIAVTNQKGGTGKSTTACAISAGLVRRGYRVLAVDLDPQCNFSYFSGVLSYDASIRDLLLSDGKLDAAEAIQHTDSGLDVISASNALDGSELNSPWQLASVLSPLDDRYDYCVIDTPPALSLLTINALMVSESVVIPAQADTASVMGIDQLATTIKAVRENGNPDLVIEGILLTQHNPRANINREFVAMIEKMAKDMGTKVFSSTIRMGIAIREAQARQVSIFSHAPKAKVTADYQAFLDELLGGTK